MASGKRWQCNGKARNGKVYPGARGPHPPHQNSADSKNCEVCGLPKQAVVSSTGLNLPTLILGVSALSALFLLIFFLRFNPCPNGLIRQGLLCITDDPTPTTTIPEIDITELETNFSRGDRVLFRGDGNPDRDSGVSAFARGDYEEAQQFFERAIANSRNDPEVQIYLSNTQARLQGNPYVFAAVVPIENREDVAKEMLRGIADAQTKFIEANQGYRLVEILIVNDAGNPELAAAVAKQIAEMNDVLGVIGHNSSDASLAALPFYAQVDLAMVSPTSTSTSLSGTTFFRTVPSDATSGETLADYVNLTLNENRVILFFDSNSNYSKSLRTAFVERFSGTVFGEFDLADQNLDVQETIRQATRSGITTGLLFPSTQAVPRAIGIMRTNAELSDREQIQHWLGGDALFDTRTLINGGAAIEGLILTIPWFPSSDYSYAAEAERRWGGRISWRTATSYDAAQALIDALSNNASRSEIVRSLREIDLDIAQTSGNALQFQSTGDRVGEPRLVQAIKGGARPLGSEYGFELMR